MISQRSKEGFLVIDNRHAPDMQGRTGVLELATITCSHCQRQIIRNPARTRDRAFCAKCDHYICDECGAAGGCVPYAKRLDDIEKQVLRQGVT